MLERWDETRAAELTSLCDAALPGENLTEDELRAVVWDGESPTIVVGSADGAGAAAGLVRPVGGRSVGFVQLVAVRPDARRRGLGSALVSAIRDWAFKEHGCDGIGVGGGSPYYLWPGVDVQATAALCLFESLGFAPRGCEVNMAYPTRHRAEVPEGIELRRALEEDDVASGLAFVDRHWPNWVAEARRAVEHASCHLAIASSDGAVVGFGCHSVNRLGWLGPMGTDPERRHGGLGNALLGAIATDLMAAGLESVQVAWVGPVGFYANAAGASVSRTFRTLLLRRS
ncbi:MAG TPA: GNAT family N-acetyltransferase [Acidimicrobiales bacterium]|nr:GNAT family N-acetyltransferase [Acidimicrobiales bacterium]